MLKKVTRAILLTGLALTAVALCCAGTIQYTIDNDVYNTCGGLYCTGGPYSLSVTFDVPSGAYLDNLSFDQGPLATGTGGNIEPYITSFVFTDGSGLEVTNSNATSDWFNIATDASGNLTAWYFNVDSASGYFETYWFPTYPQVYYLSGVSGSSGSCFDYGTSTLPATTCEGEPSQQALGGSGVPEPSTVILLGAGLLGLGVAARLPFRHWFGSRCKTRVVASATDSRG